MGGRSQSATTTTTNVKQTDRRVGAADQAKVATEGGRITSNLRNDTRTSIAIERADEPIIRAALEGVRGLTAETLSHSAREADEGRALVESALAQSGGELEGLSQLLKTTTIIAGVAAVAWVLGR